MLNAPSLVIGGTAMRNAITHLQLHSANPGAAGTTSPTTAARQPSTGVVDAAGKITWSNIAFTGNAANGPVTHVTYWSAITGGTWYGTTALTGDTVANAAGDYTITSVTETASST